MTGNEPPTGHWKRAGRGRLGCNAAGRAADQAIWICPAVVCLTSDEITAALYAFSNLMDEVPEPSPAAVRDELSFIVARYGKGRIERVADWLALNGAARLPKMVGALCPALSHAPSTERLAWCRQRSSLMLAARVL